MPDPDSITTITVLAPESRWSLRVSRFGWFLALPATMALPLFLVLIRDINCDESATYILCELSWADFVHVLWAFEGNGSLYYCVIRIWAIAFGSSMFALQAFTLLLFPALILTIHKLAMELFSNKRIALYTSILGAFHVSLIWLAGYARFYSLAILFVIVSMILFSKAMRTGSRPLMLLYAVVGAASVYTHFFGVLSIGAAQVVWLLNRVHARRWICCVLLPMGFLLIPIALFMLHLQTPDEMTVTSREQLLWLPDGSLTTLAGLQIYTGLVFGGFNPVFMMMTVVGLLVVRRLPLDGLDGSHSKTTRMLVQAWIVIPTVLIWVVSLVLNQSMLIPRYQMMMVPAVLLLAACGLARIKQTTQFRFVVLTCSISVILAICCTMRDPVDNYRADWKSAVGYLRSTSTQGCGLICLPGATKDCLECYGIAPANIYPTSLLGCMTPTLLPSDAQLRSMPSRIAVVAHMIPSAENSVRVNNFLIWIRRQGFQPKSRADFNGSPPISVWWLERRTG